MAMKLPLATLLVSDYRKKIIAPIIEKEQFEVVSFSSLKEFEKFRRSKDIQLLIMEDSFGKEKESVGIFEDLQIYKFGGRLTGNPEKNPKLHKDAKCIAIVDDLTNLSKAVGYKSIDDYIEKPNPLDLANVIKKKVRKLSEEKSFKVQGTTLGIAGLGTLGLGIAEKVKGFERVFVYSKSSTTCPPIPMRSYEELANLKGIGYKTKAFTPCGSLDELLEVNPDFLVISTGKKFDFIGGHRGEREKFLEDFLEINLPLVAPILEKIKEKKYDGITITLTTPDDFINKVAVKEYGVDPKKITTISPDNMRYKKLVFKELRRKYGNYAHNNIVEEDIESIVVGNHWRPKPIHGYTTIKGRRLSKFKKMDIDKITKDLEQYGVGIMRTHQKNKLDFEDSPLAVAQNLEKVIYYQQHKLDPIGCYIDEKFVQFPGYFDLRNKKVTKLDDYPMTQIIIESLSEEISEKTINKEYEIIQRILNKVNLDLVRV